MYKHVIFKNIGGGKRLSTALAYIGAFISVCPLVLHPRAVVREAALTILTGKWTLASVSAHMPLQF